MEKGGAQDGKVCDLLAYATLQRVKVVGRKPTITKTDTNTNIINDERRSKGKAVQQFLHVFRITSCYFPLSFLLVFFVTVSDVPLFHNNIFTYEKPHRFLTTADRVQFHGSSCGIFGEGITDHKLGRNLL
jgi:hypothetical protein